MAINVCVGCGERDETVGKSKLCAACADAECERCKLENCNSCAIAVGFAQQSRNTLDAAFKEMVSVDRSWSGARA